MSDEQRQSTWRHKDCELQGCYKKMHVCHFDAVKWGFSKDSIRPSDIDYIVEEHGHLLIQEWKSLYEPLNDGQRIMFERMVMFNTATVFWVVGDPLTMTPKMMAIYSKLGNRDMGNITQKGYLDYCEKWSKWAIKNSRLTNGENL